MRYQSTLMLCESIANTDTHTHNNTVCSGYFSRLSAAVFTPWVCASKALCPSAASTMFYKANRKVFSMKVNIRCVITEDVA